MIESQPSFGNDGTYVSAADAENAGFDNDKLWNMCSGLSDCFDFDNHKLYDEMRGRPLLFMKFHNPGGKSQGWNCHFGCRGCGRHTPEMQPQWATAAGLDKKSEKVKCAVREIISCILTDDEDELVLEAVPCTRMALYIEPLSTRRPHQLLGQLAITL